MKSLIHLFVLGIVLGACQTVKIQLSPDEMPIFGDAQLIKVELAKKNEVYKFKYLKYRSKRFPVLKEIGQLSNQGLEQFKTGKLNYEQYAEFCELARLGTQIVLWLTILESASEVSEMTDFPSKERIERELIENTVFKSFNYSQIKLATTQDEILAIIVAIRGELKNRLK